MISSSKNFLCHAKTNTFTFTYKATQKGKYTNKTMVSLREAVFIQHPIVNDYLVHVQDCSFCIISININESTWATSSEISYIPLLMPID